MTTPVPMRFEQTPLLWVVEDVYSQEECSAQIQEIERSSPTIATNNPMYRNQDRVMRDDPEMAADLFNRLRPSLPEKIGDLDLLGLNERLRFYRYVAGQEFAEHMDHWYKANDTDLSLLTVLVYFNGDFEGGETRFSEQIQRVVRPTAGSVALFQHKVRHEGCRVTSGRKYALRTDVMYRAPSPFKLTYE